ncbi:hypothetical protein GOBAR_AA04801 [Gossypium barbadense]|uniref:Protein kinase domain-containing protein n=1 Tax=Gossypium barbadense TaxID=3634 RepID=A0A2P5YJN7_GOSBA|nr:hypothetical protein GOBAR_AA04801 [Gossypium barbadense]
MSILNVHEMKRHGKVPYTAYTALFQILRSFYLWGNTLSGSIPDSISNASKLRILELELNLFSGLIPNALGNLKSLEILSLWSNNLTTKTSIHESSFFKSLENCRYLRFLLLSSNPLNCVLPTSLSNLSKSLEEFKVEACKIRGRVPVEIGSLNNAIYLDFSNNELSGSIPRTIGRLKNIQLLDFTGNKLQGPIPHELCGLKRLYGLSLAANELDGPLPACLGDLISLRKVDLSSNKLHSSIPFSFWSLKDILEVNLSSNHFNGSLPFDIGKLKVITNLDLSRNFFSSDIPPTFGSLQDLQVLLLSYNRLQGPIAESLGDMLSLKVLDLSNNNISGFIPKSLERLSYLKNFDVSFNILEGEIPNSGCFVNFTAKSFMNNYALCGSPRLQVQPCKNNIPRQNNKALLNAFKYIIPLFGSVIIVVALIIVYKKWKNKSTSLAIVEDPVPIRDWRRISYYQLSRATSGFDDNNFLGSGSFGSVYKGILAEGTEVAVKVFNSDLDEAFRSFDVECEVMGKILHRNLVKVITCCSTIDFKALVLEFMPKGSLEKWLYSDNHALNLLQRINIMIDVASALEYLHFGFLVPVVHCDLKPSNVLLDNDKVAHVGDFGIAKLLGEGDSMKQTLTLATVGYMEPDSRTIGQMDRSIDKESMLKA